MWNAQFTLSAVCGFCLYERLCLCLRSYSRVEWISLRCSLGLTL